LSLALWHRLYWKSYNFLSTRQIVFTLIRLRWNLFLLRLYLHRIMFFVNIRIIQAFIFLLFTLFSWPFFSFIAFIAHLFNHFILLFSLWHILLLWLVIWWNPRISYRKRQSWTHIRNIFFIWICLFILICYGSASDFNIIITKIWIITLVLSKVGITIWFPSIID